MFIKAMILSTNWSVGSKSFECLKKLIEKWHTRQMYTKLYLALSTCVSREIFKRKSAETIILKPKPKLIHCSRFCAQMTPEQKLCFLPSGFSKVERVPKQKSFHCDAMTERSPSKAIIHIRIFQKYFLINFIFFSTLIRKFHYFSDWRQNSKK